MAATYDLHCPTAIPISGNLPTRNPEAPTNVSWNFNVEDVARRLGFKSIDHRVSAGQALVSLPLSTAAVANRLLLSARRQWADLYLPFPISIAVGDKLVESTFVPDSELAKLQSRITDLQHEVEFPDLRYLINAGEVTFEDVLLFRRKGIRFREWLQQQSERDVNSLYAYHAEVAKAQGWTRGAQKILNLFGMVGSRAIGSVAGTVISGNPVIGAAVGGAIGGGLALLTDLGKGMLEGWTPIGFGKWYSERIGMLRDAYDARASAITPIGIEDAMRKAEEKRIRRRHRRLREHRRG